MCYCGAGHFVAMFGCLGIYSKGVSLLQIGTLSSSMIYFVYQLQY